MTRTYVPLAKKVPATLNAPYRPASTPELNARLAAMGAAAGETLGGDTLELDAGTYVVTETIRIPPHVDLVGLSRAGTVLQAGPSMTGPMIRELATSSRRFSVRNLTIDGNGRPVLGAHLNTPSVAGQEYADGMYTLEALDILDCGSGSLKIEGRGENRILDVKIRDSGGIGLEVLGADNHFAQVTIGGCQSTGVKVVGANNRFSDCKPYYCGLSDAVNGHGWWIEGSLLTVLVNCEAQDCVGHGFMLDGSDHTTLNGVVSDSNGAGHNSLAFAGNGVQVHNSDYTRVIGNLRDSNRAGQTKQQWGLEVSGWTSIVTFDVMASGHPGGDARKTNAVAGMTGLVNGVETTL